MATKLIFILSALLITPWISSSYYAMESPSIATEEDNDIKCQVCKKIVEELDQKVQEIQWKNSEILESHIEKISEKLCNLNEKEADWISRMDISRSNNDIIKPVDKERRGQCNKQCKKKIQQTCQEVMGPYDTDVSRFVYKNKPASGALEVYLCHVLSQACTIKSPPHPEGNNVGPKEVSKGTWQQRMAEGIKNTTTTLMDHAYKFRGKVQQWWKGHAKKPTESKKADL